MDYAIKIAIPVAVLVVAAEVARRSTLLGALVVSLPLTSLLAIVWLWRDTHDVERVARFAGEIPWLVLPSLAVFFVFPAMLRRGYAFPSSLVVGCVASALAYGLVLLVQRALK